MNLKSPTTLLVRRAAILVVCLLPVPFVFNSCRGNLLGGATFASSRCGVGLQKNRLVPLNANPSVKHSLFTERKVLIDQSLNAGGESDARIAKGTALAVLVDNACLLNQTGDATPTPESFLGKVLAGRTTDPNTRPVNEARTWTLDRDYAASELESLAAKEPCLTGLARNKKYTLQSVSFNDPNQGLQTYLASDNAFAAWNGFFGSSVGMPVNSTPNVTVAVIDTGADFTHPDLNARMWAGGAFGIGVDVPTFTGTIGANYYPVDISSIGHGTHVSGMIAAASNNGTGIIGVMPYHANIMSIRLFGLDSSGNLTTSSQNFYTAVHFAIDHRADVINLSLGSITQGPDSDPVALQAINDAVNAGITVVTVIGNADSGDGQLIDGVNWTSIPGMFSVIEGVIGVGAYDTTTGQKSYFSHYSTTYAEIGAPGEESSSSGLYSTIPTNLGSYGRLSGTSQAAPQVTAAAALTIGLIRNNYGVAPTPKEVERLIEAGAAQSASLQPYFKNGNYLDLSGLLNVIHQAYPFTATGQHASLNCN